MGKGAGFLIVVLVFGLIAFFVLFFEINYNYSVFDVVERTITGNVVSDMSDVDSSIYVKSDSGFVNKTVNVAITGNVVLDTSCVVERVRWDRKNAGFGDTIRLNVFGNENCVDHGVYVKFFEDDVFGDDFIDNYQGYFTGGVAYFDLKIDNRYLNLFDEDFEDGNIEFYARVMADSWDSSEKFNSKILSISSDGFDVDLAPPSDVEEFGGETGGTDGPCSSVTQYGITWTFSESETCGQFVNGDWWVLAPVTVVSKTPTQTTSPARNGDWINPRFNVQGANGAAQPYDDRLNAGAQFTFGTYDSTLRPTYPITFNTATYPTGASLVSTESQPATSDCAEGWLTFTDTGTSFNQNCQRSPVKSAAVLTILPQVPLADSFRPPYTGTDKTVRFIKSQLDYSVLGNLASTGSIGTYSISDVNRHIQRPNLQTSFWASEAVQPADNANGYGQFMAADLSLAALVVNLNYPNSQKEPLVISLVQRGIDFYGTLMNSGTWFDTGLNVNWNQAKWSGLGGHGSGRMFPIIFAGTLLHDSAMQDVGFNIDNDYSFGEIAQTFTVKDYTGYTSSNFPTKDLYNCANGGVNCGYGGYTSADIGLPEFGFSHFHAPNADDKVWLSGSTTSSYRRCCTANAWGGYLLASYIMGIEDKWNSPALFAYMDRYMEATGIGGLYYEGSANAWHRGWLPPLREMWDTYRSSYREKWTNSDLCMEGATRVCAEQRGVCLNSVETCTMKNWWGCAAPTYSPTNYTTHSQYYESTETSCDNRDNDCDGSVDEGCGATGPTAPSNFNVASINSTSLRLNWSDSVNEINYTIQRKISGNFATIATVSTNTITYTDTLLSAQTTYDYQIRANNNAGSSSWVLASGTTNQTLPLPASNLIVTTLNSTAVRLNWTDNSNNENGFAVWRCVTLPTCSLSFLTNVGINVTNYTDNGLSAGVNYSYQVGSFNTAGGGGWSNTASAVTLPNAPNSPTGLSISSINSTALRANWNDVVGETGYTLQYKLSSSSIWQNVPSAGNLVANTITFLHNGLINNTSYDYRILAFNNGGNSSFSAVASGMTQQNPAHVFTLTRLPVSGSVQQGSNAGMIVTANYNSGTGALVTFNVSNLSAGVSALFSLTSCTPTQSNPCSTTLTLIASGSAQIVTNRQVVISGTSWLSNVNTTYSLNVTAPPICINGQNQSCEFTQGVCAGSQQMCVNNNWPGCSYNSISGYAVIETGVVMCRDGLDNDCDGTRDLGGDSGCPIPSTLGFSPSLTTNLSNITDFTRVANLSVGVSGFGRIQYSGQEVSLWRNVSGVYNAINLNDAMVFANNIIGVNSESYPELNQTANLTFYNLSYSERPAVMVQTAIGLEICSSTRCPNQYYNRSTGELIVTVVGFSNYSTQTAACGDSYCSLAETCISCSSDCGTCPGGSSSGSSGGSSGGGGGGGGSGGRKIVTQCNDKKDNDNDGYIDYPYDSGCLNKEDNIELDAPLIVNPTGNEDLNNSASESEQMPNENSVSEKEVKSFDIVFWIVLTLLVSGIVIAGIMIIRSIMRHKKLKELMYVPNYREIKL